MKLTAKYELNKSKSIGDGISCPICNKNFIKKNKQQAFCGERGNTRCKDKYWNTVDSNKRNNTTRISPASARWLDSKQEEREHRRNYDYDDHPFSCEGLGQWDD